MVNITHGQTGESLSDPRPITVSYEEDRLNFFSIRTVYSTRLKILIVPSIKGFQYKLELPA